MAEKMAKVRAAIKRPASPKKAQAEHSVKTIAEEAPEPPVLRSRKAEIRRERRRRDTEIDGARMRLAIPTEYKNDPDHEYRWINDDKARVHDLTIMDDWDAVKADDIENHHGANSVRRQVGTKASGEPLFAQLVRKPRDLCDEDRAKKQALLDETMAQVTAKRTRGDPVSFGGQTGYVAADTSFRDERKS
jgi:hypothetical protein